ncbi:MAG: transglutaminase-like domain-containing protein, partial [Clostridia bacterium]|nr:transglutaminase-like domain-containing protein [Clostridia bacterium]
MKLTKKILSALIICTMLVPSVALAEYNEVSDIQLLSLGEDYSVGLFSSDIELTDKEKKLLNDIVGKLANRESEITLKAADYGITNYERYYEVAGNCLGALIQYEHPELFYIDLKGIHFGATATPAGLAVDLIVYTTTTYNKGTEYEETINAYTMNKETETAKQALIDEEYEKITAMLDDGMTPFQKILTVHDYIAANYEYDTALKIRTLDRMVEEKKGVCQGYSYLFKYVLDKLNAEDDLGIECVTVPSNARNHMWNKVKLDGKWYNVDVTHDDPTPNGSANINHSHFLLTDEEI